MTTLEFSISNEELLESTFANKTLLYAATEYLATEHLMNEAVKLYQSENDNTPTQIQAANECEKHEERLNNLYKEHGIDLIDMVYAIEELKNTPVKLNQKALQATVKEVEQMNKELELLKTPKTKEQVLEEKAIAFNIGSDKLSKIVDEKESIVKAISKGHISNNGLVSDEIAVTPEYKKARRELKIAFKRFQGFNSLHTKQVKTKAALLKRKW